MLQKPIAKMQVATIE